MILALLACSAPEPAAPAADVPCDGSSETTVLLARQLTFGRRTDGVSNGFDLDGVVSDDDDAQGCYQEDLVAPDGTPGIDNTFSAFLPVLETTEGAALEGLVQQAIDSGELLLMFSVEDLDDRVDDGCVGLEVLEGTGTPRLGTDGLILSGQTFDRDPDNVSSRVDDAAVADGVLTARGIERLEIPVQIFELQFSLRIHDAAVSLTLDPDEGATGYVSGAVEVQQIIDLIEPRKDIAIRELAIDLLRSYADLYPDETGACPYFSIVLELEATSAFLYEEGPVDTGGDSGDTGG